ncbi:MAG TPA: cation transporter [Clostridia bacterium]
MKKESGERTLLASVILSSPGPIVVGIGLFLGRSSTQLADFIRRTAELAAIIVSWAIYRVTHKNPEYDENHRQRLERIAGNCVGAALCLSGIAMLLVTFLYPSKEKGNVTAGLIIAVLGVITNSWFWIRYKMLNKTNPNRILAVQSRLYRAKALVDACVTAALIVVSVCPGSPAAYYMDIAGSAAVAVYLLINGADTLFGRPKESFA